MKDDIVIDPCSGFRKHINCLLVTKKENIEEFESIYKNIIDKII